MTLEPPSTIRDAILSPFLEGSDKKRMYISRSQYSHLLVHHHMRANAVSAKVMERDEPLSIKIADLIDIDKGIYGGILFHNFGHFLTESIHRLWPLVEQKSQSNEPILFHVPRLNKDGNYIKRFMIDILGYLGIDWQRVKVIEKPTRVRTLVVAKQAKLLGGPPDPSYNDLLLKRAELLEKPMPQAAVYVSRTAFLHTGSYIGETFVERRLRDCGFHIHYPESVPFKESIKLYRSAKNIVFSEGSAVHALELAGRIDANVLIVARRSKTFVQQIFIEPLRSICKHIDCFDTDFPITPLHWDKKKNHPTISASCSVNDLNGLLRRIEAMVGMSIPEFTESQIADARMIDIYKMLFQGPLHSNLSNEQIGMLIHRLRDDLVRIGLKAAD